MWRTWVPILPTETTLSPNIALTNWKSKFGPSPLEDLSANGWNISLSPAEQVTRSTHIVGSGTLNSVDIVTVRFIAIF